MIYNRLEMNAYSPYYSSAVRDKLSANLATYSINEMMLW